jgi:hypothetical protein
MVSAVETKLKGVTAVPQDDVVVWGHWAKQKTASEAC